MGVGGCTRCLDVCATVAIRSAGEKIEVDPYLCQGCASCSMACPTGALSFQEPTPKALQGMLNDLLAESAGDVEARFLVVHDADSRHLMPVIEDPDILLFEVNPLPAFSDVLWLTALLGGVSGVVLVVAPATQLPNRNLLEQKLSELRAILATLGGDPAVLQIATPMNVGIVIDKLSRSARPPALAAALSSSLSDEKRADFLASVDALVRCAQATGQLSGRVAESVAFEPSAAFGTILVDAEKCTICLACTHLCPTGALSGQVDPAPALYFKESLCVQCDLCRAGCPEKAITLQPRFLMDAELRDASREIASDQLVPCISCGTPFVGRRKLAVSLALMQEHAKDMPGGIDSLRMCPSCRQRETMIG